MRGLPKELADIVAAHLVMAGQLIDTDAELAYGHAEAARRRAARLPIIREATAETAYASGHFDVALTEYRALRRMTGEHHFLPVMADCERALGRPQTAVKLSREADGLGLDGADWVEMRIVESGARSDLGQTAEAIRVLRDALSRMPDQPGRSRNAERLRLPTARMHYALGELLLGEFDEAGARGEFALAAGLDVEGEIDAQERLDQLDGVEIDFDDSDEVDSDEVDSDEVDSDEVDSDDGDEVDSDDGDEVDSDDGDEAEIEEIDDSADEPDERSGDEAVAESSQEAADETPDPGPADPGDEA